MAVKKIPLTNAKNIKANNSPKSDSVKIPLTNAKIIICEE